jgi:cation-transporting ATPase 13A1
VPLDINGEHRAHVLFSGTSVMQIDGSKSATRRALKAPDGGCVCVCLRTGFASSQGTLVRMIEFSSEQVMGSTKESITLLLILLMFAIVASSYVLYNGLHDGKRTQYQLVIRCVLILDVGRAARAADADGGRRQHGDFGALARARVLHRAVSRALRRQADGGAL